MEEWQKTLECLACVVDGRFFKKKTDRIKIYLKK